MLFCFMGTSCVLCHCLHYLLKVAVAGRGMLHNLREGGEPFVTIVFHGGGGVNFSPKKCYIICDPHYLL